MQRPRNLFFLSALFIFAGAMHFVIPRGYAAIMPQWVPLPGLQRLAGLGLISAQPRTTL
ncbi:MAG: hypothetical protein Q7S20_09395 [Gemmatimonadaceae bacterium]|nr:hypothetical protein [Gemmatimonadaceae bacterium]